MVPSDADSESERLKVVAVKKGREVCTPPCRYIVTFAVVLCSESEGSYSEEEARTKWLAT